MDKDDDADTILGVKNTGQAVLSIRDSVISSSSCN